MSWDARLPGFLQDATNKEELFNLPTEYVVRNDYPLNEHSVYIITGPRVKSNRADIHQYRRMTTKRQTAECAYMQTMNKGTPIVLRTIETGVVIILIGEFHDIFPAPSRTTVIVGFSTGKNFRYYPINPIPD